MQCFIFKTNLQTVCQACIKEEEKAFETVYKFLRKQINRQSTMQQITEETGVDEELILKFIKQKGFRSASFQIWHILAKGAEIRSGRGNFASPVRQILSHN